MRVKVKVLKGDDKGKTKRVDAGVADRLSKKKVVEVIKEKEDK